MATEMSLQKPVVTNAANEEGQRRAKDQVAQSERTLRDAYAKLLGTAEGQLVLWDMLDFCGVYRSIFDASGSRLNYNSGKQDVGHYLQAKIAEANPAALITMMQSKLTK